MNTSQKWVEEDRAEIVEQIVDGMMTNMTYESIRQCVWDMLYDDLVHQDWQDIWMHAEVHAPEVIEQFQEQAG